jgi:acetoin utilization deacetylase AcuC-like enzyme
MKRVAYAWDEECLRHDSGPALRIDQASAWIPTPHFESPERLVRCHQALQASGRLDDLVPIPPRPATEDELRLVHTPDHIAMVRASEDFVSPMPVGDAVRAGPGSWPAALAAAGATIAAVEEVVHGRADASFALVRPPGHHASAELAMGSCLFNNIAIATRYAQRHLGVARVAIVDWDVHHGNGTEDTFAADSSVLFLSIHQEDFYPPGRGHVEDRGRGAGVGSTVNIPFPAGSGDAGYLAAFDEIVVPALRNFAADLVVISAGQDAAGTDPLGRMCLTAEGFRGMTARVRDVAHEVSGGRVVAVQEGGYSLSQMPWCVLAIVEELLEVEPTFAIDPMETDGPKTVRPEELAAIERARP